MVTGVPSGRRIVPPSIMPLAMDTLVTVVPERLELTIVDPVPRTMTASRVEPLIVALVVEELVIVELTEVVFESVEVASVPPEMTELISTLLFEVAFVNVDKVTEPPLTTDVVTVLSEIEALRTVPYDMVVEATVASVSVELSMMLFVEVAFVNVE